jgi:hypothetical protein
MAQLYRHFDGAGNLLYVGISLFALRRLAAHEVHAGLWGDVRTITITPYPNRNDAARAEVEAIRNEKPRFDQQHAANPVKPPVAAADLGKGLLKRLKGQGEAGASESDFKKRTTEVLTELKSLSSSNEEES